MPASAIVVKEIKPQRFKDAAFKRAMQQVARQAAKEMQKDFDKTVATWSSKPKFEQIVQVDPDVEVLVGTDNQVYSWLNDGTGGKGKGPTYPIPKVPKVAGALRFKWGGKGSYRAKTKPRLLGSQPGGPSGPWVAFKQVQHPGIEPREFDKTIERKWRSPFKRRMEKAMSQAARASGHGIP